MQGIDADTVVGIRVLPGVRDVGIVDGQYLQHTLLGLVAPVNHQLQVAEIANAETALTAERENGNHRSRTFPGINGEVSLCQFVDDHIACLKVRQRHGTVHSVLPKRGDVDLFVKGHELEIEGLRQLVGVEADDPLVVVVLCHVDGALGLPVAECLSAADDGQSLEVTQLWSAYFQPDGFGIVCRSAHLQLACSHTFCECS